MGGIRKAMEVRKYSADLNKRKQNECIIYIFLLSIYYVLGIILGIDVTVVNKTHF